MIYAAILASGTGSRMGKTKKPKQFLKLAEKPIIIHTIEKFLINEKISKVLVLVQEEWKDFTMQLVGEYCEVDASSVEIVIGGETRDQTIVNSIDYIKEKYGLNPEDSLITHDAVRPMVSTRIIDDNIEGLKGNDCVNTAIPSADTIIEIDIGMCVENIPNRKNIYCGQTPQSFKIEKYMELFSKLNENQRNKLTDAANVFVMSGEKVKVVLGDITNMKVTTVFDLSVINSMLEVLKNDKL